MQKFSLNEQRQIVGSHAKLQEFHNGEDITKLFNRIRPDYPLGYYRDVFGYNGGMRIFKSNYLKYKKDGYFDTNGLKTIKYGDVSEKTIVNISDIESISKNTLYKREAAIVHQNGNSLYIDGIDKNRVEIPTRLIRGSDIIHSHPNGTSLSAEDIIETITFGGKSVSAFNDRYLYIFKNNIVDDSEFIGIFNKQLSKVEAILIKKVNNGTITRSQMDFSINHKVWIEISNQLKGFYYEAYEISR